MYRIVTDGVKFKIQHQIEVGFWCLKHLVWRDVGTYLYKHFVPDFYSTKEEAQEAIKRFEQYHPWKVVD